MEIQKGGISGKRNTDEIRAKWMERHPVRSRRRERKRRTKRRRSRRKCKKNTRNARRRAVYCLCSDGRQKEGNHTGRLRSPNLQTSHVKRTGADKKDFGLPIFVRFPHIDFGRLTSYPCVNALGRYFFCVLFISDVYLPISRHRYPSRTTCCPSDVYLCGLKLYLPPALPCFL